MKYFKDGDQLAVTKDDFVSLQESPAIFIPLAGEMAQIILSGGIKALPVGDLVWLRNELAPAGATKGANDEMGS